MSEQKEVKIFFGLSFSSIIYFADDKTYQAISATSIIKGGPHEIQIGFINPTTDKPVTVMSSTVGTGVSTQEYSLYLNKNDWIGKIKSRVAIELEEIDDEIEALQRKKKRLEELLEEE